MWLVTWAARSRVRRITELAPPLWTNRHPNPWVLSLRWYVNLFLQTSTWETITVRIGLKLFATTNSFPFIHNALGQLTNHNTFRFSEGGPSSNPKLIEPFVPDWGERYCNNVNYVKNNALFESPSMRACSSTPPKQNQDFVKEHNRTPLISW